MSMSDAARISPVASPLQVVPAPARPHFAAVRVASLRLVLRFLPATKLQLVLQLASQTLPGQRVLWEEVLLAALLVRPVAVLLLVPVMTRAVDPRLALEPRPVAQLQVALLLTQLRAVRKQPVHVMRRAAASLAALMALLAAVLRLALAET